MIVGKLRRLLQRRRRRYFFEPPVPTASGWRMVAGGQVLEWMG